MNSANLSLLLIEVQNYYIFGHLVTQTAVQDTQRFEARVSMLVRHYLCYNGYQVEARKYMH